MQRYLIIMPEQKHSLQKIQKVFMDAFRSTNLKIPEENLWERKPGSLPYGSGRILFIFGKEDGREYFEFYAHHRIGGDSHAKIFDNGEWIDLPELSSMYTYNSDIPGDKEKNEAEMERAYQEIYEDLERKGLLSVGQIPGSLLINSHLVMKDKTK